MIKVMVDKIISETINGYLRDRKMLKEYKNPQDSESVRVCADQLENLYNKILSNGGSKNEYTIMRLAEIINELRKLAKFFSV